MDINTITAISEGKQTHARLMSIEASAIPGAPRFKVLYLYAVEIKEVFAGVAIKQQYEAYHEALKYTAHWPAFMHKAFPIGQLHAKVADVLIMQMAGKE